MTNLFHRIATRAVRIMRTPQAFAVAVLMIILWLVSGPVFHFSDTWQLVINTGTTIVTFLMSFLIIYGGYLSDMAVQLKLDEIIRSIKDARNTYIDVEDAEAGELEQLAEEMAELRQEEQHV